MRAREQKVGGLAAVLGFALMTGISAQQKAADKPDVEKSGPTPLTLAGCVVKGSGPNDLTIDDEANGKYRVSGNRIGRYVGQRVEVVGNVDTARLRIRGGLYPTPNAAGQAGAIDPVKAAIAAQPGGTGAGTGEVELPALKVKSVKALSGGCR